MPKSSVVSRHHGIVHALGCCQECDWMEGIEGNKSNRMDKLRSKIYSHVIKTGHSVCLETGTSTIYSEKRVI